MNYFQGNQSTKTNESCSSWEQILFEVPQGSVLRPIFFNICLNDLSLILNDADIANCADDNAFHKACGNVEAVAKTLRMLTENLFKWFKDNQTKDNTDRFHLILNTGHPNQIQTGNSLIKGNLCEKPLSGKFNYKLAFDQNVKIIFKKAKAKLKVLARVVSYIALEKKKY